MDGSTDSQQEPTFRDLVELLRRGLLVALIVALGAALATYFLTKRLAPTYRATATVLASQPDSALQQFGVSLVTAPTVTITAYQAAATSNPVVVAGMKSLGIKNPTEKQVEDLLRNVSVRVDSVPQSGLLHIDVKNSDPKMAADVANALSNALLAWDKQRATQNLHKIVDALQGQIASLDAQIAQSRASTTVFPSQISGLQNLRAQQSLQLNAARALENSAVGSLEILGPAVVPTRPIAPRPRSDSAIAFVLGIFLVYGILLIRDALDSRFRGTEDLARVSDAPVLAEFPKLWSGNRRLPREAANYLRTNALFSTAQDHPKLLLVTSADPSEGKTSVAMALAESFARNDYQTLLIDADLRKPTISKEYGISQSTQLPLYRLLEEPDRAYDPTLIRLGSAQLHVVPSFGIAPFPTETLSRNIGSVLSRFRNAYDVIVIDSPPVLPVADALTVAPHCTGVVFAVSLPSSDRRRVKAALGLLNRIGVRLTGLVVTGLEESRHGRGEYGYGYGERRESDEKASQPVQSLSDAAGQVAHPVSQSRVTDRAAVPDAGDGVLAQLSEHNQG